LPQAAANRIAREYIDGQIFYEPFVRIMITQRGAHYAPLMGPTSQSLWIESNIVFDRNSIEARRRDRQRYFISYISAATLTETATAFARIYYYRWIQEHANQADFFTMEPHQVWSLSLQQAFTPPPPSPIQPFLDLMSSMHSRARAATGDERNELYDTLNRYTGWLDIHMNDQDISRLDPVEIWTQMWRQTFDLQQTQIRERFLRDQQTQREQSPQLQQASVTITK
jgi:hypothetical protein